MLLLLLLLLLRLKTGGNALISLQNRGRVVFPGKFLTATRLLSGCLLS